MNNVSGNYDFLMRGGEIAENILKFNWAETSLGPIDSWDHHRRELVALMLSIPSPALKICGNDRVLLHNGAFSLLYGKSVIGHKLDVLEPSKEFVDAVNSVFDGAPAPVDVFFGANSEFTCTFLPGKDESGNVVHTGVYFSPVGLSLEKLIRDRTRDLSSKNEELALQNEFTREIIDSSVDIIVVYNTSMNYLAVNKKWKEIFSEKYGDVIGKHVFDLFPALKGMQFESDIQRALQGETVHNAIYFSQIMNRTFENFFIPLKKQGRVYAVLSVGHDLTEKINAQKRLEKANLELEQKNKELERSNSELASFSYVASHDLREPLRKIQAFGKRISEKYKSELSEGSVEYFNRMIDAASRMQSLIEALLEFSRTTTMSKVFESTDLNAVVEEVRKDFHDQILEKRIDFSYASMPVLNVIPFQFKQLLSNLVSNAIKYSKDEPGAFVRVEAEKVNSRDIADLRATAPGDYYRISVSDNGIGFDEVNSFRIFELFQRLHGRQEYGGSGIGLSICKKIAENHGGFIVAKSKEGEGSTFSVFVPVL